MIKICRILSQTNKIGIQTQIFKNINHRILKPIYYLSSQSKQRLQSILKSINVDAQGQTQSLLDSGLILKYQHDQANNKVQIVIRTGKDFARLRSILKIRFQKQGYANTEVLLEHSQDKKTFQRKGSLKQIKNIIAVASCKGGVGKSTVAINLAFQLQKQGHKVGIFDADVYGPSLPTLVHRQGATLKSSTQDAKKINPVVVQSVKCMSYGFVSIQSSVIRGPMASSIVSNLLLQTDWGQLDYLIVDTPPGTGDINLQLCQQLKFDGAVIVTTPQKLSFVDVIKGIKMFHELRVRILGVVENMSYYSCPGCKIQQKVFGEGHIKIIRDQLGIQTCFQIPLMGQISKISDNGLPAILSFPKEHQIAQTYADICNNLKIELLKPKQKTGVYYDTSSRLIIVQQDKKRKKIISTTLRAKCKCPKCYNDLSGQYLVTKTQIDPQIFPSSIEQRGNYAISIFWSDGHKDSIYSYKRLFSDQIAEK